MSWRVIVGTLSLVITMILLGYVAVTEQDRMANFSTAYQARQVEAGASLFESNCSPCHGLDGKGSARAPALNTADLLTNGKRLTEIGWSGTVHDYILATVSGGRPRPSVQFSQYPQRMPTWSQDYGGPLRDDQIQYIVAFILNWAPALAATQPAPQIARPSNSGGPGAALNLTGNATAGQEIFVANCQKCHGPQGQAGVNNPGSDDGTVPHLNPIDSTLVNSEQPVFAFNLDLFIEHGSTPSGSSPQLSMPAWGDQKKLTPQQIADVMAYVISLNTAAGTPTPNGPAIARPSNPGGPGQALNLTGDATAGQTVFVGNCQKCHGPQGQAGVNNPGSDDGTVPHLNPIDSTLANSDPLVFAYNVDRFIEHGSTPSGSSPQLSMPAWGDQKKLTPQQIADVIAYVITLNPTVPVTATQAAPATQSVTVATDITQPLPQGDPSSGQQLVQTLGCPACHISQGGAATLGPNWQPAADNNNQGIGTRAPLRITAADYKGKATTAEQYLFESIVAPDAYIVPGNPAYAPGGTSIMPHDLSTKMSAQNLADVIAYLQTIK